MTVAIVQPAYLPWLGYFDQMAKADLFIHYDDVQYSRKSWHSRNRIKTPAGADWLSVPVGHTGRPPLILDAPVAQGVAWAKRHLGLIQACYRQAPFFGQYFPELEDILNQPWKWLVELNCTLAHWLAGKLDCAAAKVVNVSSLNVAADLDTTLRPLAVCRAVGATRFLCGPTAKAYINPGAFADAGIELVWHTFEPVAYPQLWGEFVPRLSAIDALLMLGPKAASLIGR